MNLQAQENRRLREDIDKLAKELEDLQICNTMLEDKLLKQSSKLRRANERSSLMMDIYKQKDPAVAVECLIKELISKNVPKAEVVSGVISALLKRKSFMEREFITLCTFYLIENNW
jgi:hypothetical protein